MADAPTFTSRDYGDRTAPDEAAILAVGEEEDTTVYAWAEGEDAEGIWIQQGYDMVYLDADALLALQHFARVERAGVPGSTTGGRE